MDRYEQLRNTPATTMTDAEWSEYLDLQAKRDAVRVTRRHERKLLLESMVEDSATLMTELLNMTDTQFQEYRQHLLQLRAGR